jgi:hypothetical protein
MYDIRPMHVSYEACYGKINLPFLYCFVLPHTTTKGLSKLRLWA